MMWFRLIFALFFCIVFDVRSESLLICSSCGREAAMGSDACRHCGKVFPRVKEKSNPVQEQNGFERKAPATTDVEEEADRLVRASVAAYRSLQKERPLLAFYYGRNALAISRLVAQGAYTAAMRDTLSAYARLPVEQLRWKGVRCRKCKGTKSVRLQVVKEDGTVARGPMRNCPLCRGRGTVRGPAPVAESASMLQREAMAFERERVAAGDVRFGHLFLPESLLKKLDVRQKALLLTGAWIPCQSCGGIGREACRSCDETGWEECRESDCEEGVLKEKKRKRGVRRLNDPAMKKCPVCGGEGDVACAKCRGEGSVVCRRCKGSGGAPMCRRCRGEGFQPCRRCQGTGTLKGDPCPVCKGDKISLCSACQGEGVMVK